MPMTEHRRKVYLKPQQTQQQMRTGCATATAPAATQRLHLTEVVNPGTSRQSTACQSHLPRPSAAGGSNFAE
jgi:hypothetical protein